MKVLLVFPNSPISSEPCCEGYNPAKLMPYELIHSAGNIETDFSTKIIDAKVENLDLEEIKNQTKAFAPDITVLWTTPYSLLKDLKILKMAKELGCLTIIAMNAPILLKQLLERFPFIDVAVTNYKEVSIKEIAKKYEAGKTFFNVNGIVFRSGEKIVERPLGTTPEYSKLPKAAFHLAPMDKYNKSTALIRSSKGCPHQCAFCAWGRSQWKKRNAEQIAEEIEDLIKNYHYKNIGFLDLHFTINKNHVYDFLKEIDRKKLNFKWFCDSRVDVVEKEYFADMKKGGFARVIFGVEHVNQQILENMKKHQTKEDVEKAVSISKKLKINVATPLILGFPGETKETIKELKQFIFTTKPNSYSVLPPIPFPGTDLFKQAKKNNWLLVEEKPENFWAKSDFSRTLMRIPTMTEKELSRARKELQFLPRLHPVIFSNTLKDLYLKGGMTKVFQVVTAAFSVLKSDKNNK